MIQQIRPNIKLLLLKIKVTNAKKITHKNFSLIRDIVVNFEDDFSVITGETGSGKSLMLNALATLVGGKIKYSSFTNADKKTIIEGQFILNDSYKVI